MCSAELIRHRSDFGEQAAIQLVLHPAIQAHQCVSSGKST